MCQEFRYTISSSSFLRKQRAQHQYIHTRNKPYERNNYSLPSGTCQASSHTRGSTWKRNLLLHQEQAGLPPELPSYSASEDPKQREPGMWGMWSKKMYKQGSQGWVEHSLSFCSHLEITYFISHAVRKIIKLSWWFKFLAKRNLSFYFFYIYYFTFFQDYLLMFMSI